MSGASDFTFLHPLRVRWAECDIQEIVYNVNYFLYFDVAVTEWFRALGFAQSSKNLVEFVTVHARSDFRAPARYDEMIEIGVRCARLGTKSMDVALEIYRDGEVLNQGLMTYAHFDQALKATTPIPQMFIDRVMELERKAPLMERKSDG